jgi:hypothetical protein
LQGNGDEPLRARDGEMEWRRRLPEGLAIPVSLQEKKQQLVN